MKKDMKAYLIDVAAETVTEVPYNGDYQTMYPLLKCSTFTTATPRGLKGRDTIFVDDEGLLTLTSASKFFLFEGYPQPLVGNGLVMGCNAAGESTSPKTPLEYVKSKVKFLTLEQARAIAS